MCEQIMPTHSTQTESPPTSTSSSSSSLLFIVQFVGSHSLDLYKYIPVSLHLEMFGKCGHLFWFKIEKDLVLFDVVHGVCEMTHNHTCKHSFAGPKNDWHYSLVAHFRFPFKSEHNMCVSVYLLLCLKHQQRQFQSIVRTHCVHNEYLNGMAWCAFKQFSNILAFSCFVRAHKRARETLNRSSISGHSLLKCQTFVWHSVSYIVVHKRRLTNYNPLEMVTVWAHEWTLNTHTRNHSVGKERAGAALVEWKHVRWKSEHARQQANDVCGSLDIVEIEKVTKEIINVVRAARERERERAMNRSTKTKINRKKTHTKRRNCFFSLHHFSRAFGSVVFYWEHSIWWIYGWMGVPGTFGRTYLHTSYNGEFDAFQSIFRINNVKLDT